MKSRTGFVSNSSSCSFVLVIKKSDKKDFDKSMDPIQRDVMKMFEKSTTEEFMNTSCIIYSGEIGYLDEEGIDMIIGHIEEQFTKDEIDELEHDPYGSSKANKKFNKIFGYGCSLSEAFEAIRLPDDCLYTTVDS